MRKWLLCGFLIAGAACNNGNGSGNGDGGNGDGGGGGGGNFAVVSLQTPIGPGTDCANGGTKVELGLDNGDGGGVARDSALQPGEVDKTEFICNTSPGNADTLTLLTPLGVGDTHCANGGTKVDYGFDNGDGGGTANDTILQTGEIDGTSYVCLNAPGNLLVVTTPILPGDVDCTYGGNLVSSGLDNGDGGGVTSDGILQDGEVDLTSKKCSPAPDEVFPNPGGAIGSAFIDVSGGNGPGSGGGNGGQVDFAAFGGPLATSVEARRNGSVSVNAPPAAPAFTAGAKPLVISTNTTIAYATTSPGAGIPYIFNDTAAVNPFTYAIYVDDAPITSLKINAGVTLTFENSSQLRVRVQGDVHNQGTIKANFTSEANTVLVIEAKSFNNDTGATIDMRLQGYTISLEIWTLYNGGGAFRNAGSINTSGRHYDDPDGTDYPTYPGYVRITSAGDADNEGTIEAHGGNGSSSSDSGTSGNTVAIHTLKGNLFNNGTIDVSGGSGYDGGSGGSILFFNHGDNTDFESDVHPATQDFTSYGPGAFNGTGTFKAIGGNSDSGYAGTGGDLVIRTAGGAIRSNVYTDVRGGATLGSSFSRAGDGGSVLLAAFTWVGPTGAVAPIVPAGIFIGQVSSTGFPTAGTIDARGGEGGTGATSGGNGGQVALFLDATLTSNFRDKRGSSDWYRWLINQEFDLGKLNATGAKPQIAVYGYGGNIKAKGGNSGSYLSGSGGRINFSNSVCPSDALQCALPGIGARLVFNDTTLEVQSGISTSYANQGAGNVNFELTQGGNIVPAIASSTLLKSAGQINAFGADTTSSFAASYPYGGSVYFQANSGEIDVTGDINLNGGLMGSGSAASGGGEFQAEGFLVDLRSDISASAALASSNGSSGYIGVNAYRANVAETGHLETHGRSNEGSNIDINVSSALINAGSLDASGQGVDFSLSRGGAGSYIRVQGGSVTNTGTMTAEGAAYAGGAAGNGGYINLRGTSLTSSGVISASGAENHQPTSQGGNGGNIDLSFPTTSGTTVVRADGGKAGFGATTVTDANGGNGGNIYAQFGTTLAFSASGGDATSQTGTGKVVGGNGGNIDLGDGDVFANAADMTAKGGNAGGTVAGSRVGGNGGSVYLGQGTNAAGSCFDVTGGTGLTAGTVGTITLPSGQQNYCE